MSSASGAAGGDHQRLLAEALRLAGEGKAERLDELHPEARDPAFVEALCAEATKQVRVDVRRAERLAELANRLADELGGRHAAARSRRARANVLHVKGEYDRALAAYEEALALFAGEGDELEEGITRSSSLQTLSYLGLHEQAADWAERARGVFAARGDRLRLARLELNLGTIVYRQDRIEEARRNIESAYERLLEVGGPRDVAHCLRNLATIYITLKEFDRAEEAYGRARAYCEREQLPLLLAEVEYNVAYLYYLRGDYTTAIELYRTTRQRCEATDESYHLALCDLDEAEIYLEINLVDEAVRTSDAAFRRFESLGMPYEAAKAVSYLALARIRQGKTILGIELLDRARELFVAERNRVWVGLVDLYKALALARQGRRFEAESLARNALEVFEASSLPTKVVVCEALLAEIGLEGGELESARRLSSDALERLADLDHPALGHQVHSIRGRIEEAAGNLPAALAAYEAAHHELARQRSRVQAEELKLPLLGDKLEVYESLVALMAGDEPTVRGEPIFEYVEIAKARSLSDLTAFRGIALPTRVTARSAQVERVRRLREEINWYYRRIDLHEMTQQEPSADELGELRSSTRRAEDELSESLRELAVADPEFASLETATAGRLDDIRSALPPDSQLLEYYVARDTLYACLMDEDRCLVVPVSLASRVREIQQRLSDQLLKFRLGERHVARFSERIHRASLAVLSELYDELVAPLEPELSARLLVVVPHRFLHWTPFHALFDGERHLLDRFALCYAPTATVFHMCRAKQSGSGHGGLVLAAGDAAAVEAEVEAVAAALPGARRLTGEAATVANLRRGGERCGILHLAVRGVFRQDNPMFSRLELADGDLSLFELYRLRLGADLVGVSGCGGSLENLSDGDERVGLARGLLYAGPRTALLPLWDPPREVGARLMGSFYRRLPAAPDRAAALRRAVLELREEHPHVFHWAPWALVGSPY